MYFEHPKDVELLRGIYAIRPGEGQDFLHKIVDNAVVDHAAYTSDRLSISAPTDLFSNRARGNFCKDTNLMSFSARTIGRFLRRNDSTAPFWRTSLDNIHLRLLFLTNYVLITKHHVKQRVESNKKYLEDLGNYYIFLINNYKLLYSFSKFFKYFLTPSPIHTRTHARTHALSKKNHVVVLKKTFFHIFMYKEDISQDHKTL